MSILRFYWDSSPMTWPPPRPSSWTNPKFQASSPWRLRQQTHRHPGPDHGLPRHLRPGDALKAEHDAWQVYIDGETGQVAIEPDDITLAAFRSKQEKQQKIKELMGTMKDQRDVTLDDRVMIVYCNIDFPEDVTAVQYNDGQGIGLFRSEFLYLAASDYPTEEDQFQAYKNVATAMGGTSGPARR